MFKNTDSKMEFEYFEATKVPKIIFPAETLAIMKFIVDTVPEEVGWLGYIEQSGDNIIVKDIYIPGQHAHGTTCELDEGDPLTKICLQVVAEGKDPSNIKFWAHSHGNGGVWPSGQDKTQSMAMMKDLGDFMVRAICNKSGVMSVAYYDNINKRIVENIAWYINDGIDHAAIEAKFGPIIKENVKQFTYTEDKSGKRYDHEGWPTVPYEGRGAYSPNGCGFHGTNAPGKGSNVPGHVKKLFEERAKRGSGRTNFSLVSSPGGGK